MHRVESFNIIATHSGRVHRVAKVKFACDGSIYVMFPGFPKQSGLVGQLRIPPGPNPPLTLSLADSGRVTSHLVKYSHHPDGRAHFSQDGKVVTEIKRQAVPLALQHAHLFTVQLQGLNAGAPPRSNDKSFFLNFNLEGEFKGLKIVCWRYPLRLLVPIARHTPYDTPKGIVLSDGRILGGLFAAPPEGFAFDDYVLFFSPDEWVNEQEDPCLIFLGGFDPLNQALNQSNETQFLAFLYPCSDPMALQHKLGTIDFKSGATPK